MGMPTPTTSPSSRSDVTRTVRAGVDEDAGADGVAELLAPDDDAGTLAGEETAPPVAPEPVVLEEQLARTSPRAAARAGANSAKRRRVI
jgi:hypothetical protein